VLEELRSKIFAIKGRRLANVRSPLQTSSLFCPLQPSPLLEKVTQPPTFLNMTAFFKICLVALLASAQLAYSKGVIACRELKLKDEDFVARQDIPFRQDSVNGLVLFKAHTLDGTKVRSVKRFRSKTKYDILTSIYNKNEGGPTRVALKFYHKEEGKDNKIYTRYFNVPNGSPACLIGPVNGNAPSMGEEVLTEAYYITKNTFY
jgi:hypothetical protein